MITLREESTDRVAVFQATGEVTDADYKLVLIPSLEKVAQASGEMRTVLYFDEGFSGYELKAMADDAVFGMENLKKFKKISVIGLHGWMESLINLADVMAPNVVKQFQPTELVEAIAWANS